MIDRKTQIEEVLQDFYSIKNILAKGAGLHTIRGGITQSQWIVLRTVFQNPSIGIKELASSLGISSSAATQLVNALVKKSYLVREVSGADRRALNLRVNEKIRESIETNRLQILDRICNWLSVLSDEEIKVFCELSKKVAGALKANQTSNIKEQ
jgi:DNA-binding MarR family transcriptional regulator